MFGFLKALLKIGGTLLLIFAAAALLFRYFLPKYPMTEQFDSE